jgi:hypothetical protein
VKRVAADAVPGNPRERGRAHFTADYFGQPEFDVVEQHMSYRFQE